ncbi:S8 family serine peptidase [Crossiella cryophila]|uniref:Subtilisin family serine protease n=1 Tax=Crossiella cryophila TaxID=43355 RepID=A0A7W7CHH5_9PSEU|nr:S8 family serine peptidase [Crossiella cryophila]MBB4679579.1 subtilisin family serine protease [Crossiella cryophila]
MGNPPRQAAAPDQTGKGVVVGVVDSGIDVHHPAFRNGPTGPTRIVRLLDQVITTRQTIGHDGPVGPGSTVRFSWTVPGAPQKFQTDVLAIPLTKETLQAQLTQPGRIPAADVQVSGGPFPDQDLVIDFVGRYAATGFDPYNLDSVGVQPGGTNWTPTIKFGREYTQQEIDKALTDRVDPFYSRDAASGHGTHVMGIAAGSSVELDDSSSADTVVGIAKQADLVAVRTSLGDDDEIVEAIRFILDQPWRAPGTLAKPAVANLSIGGSDGPHDGTSRLERELDKLVVGTKGRVIVVSAGNEADKVDPEDDVYLKSKQQPRGGMHTVGTVPANTENKHTIIVPDDHDKLLELHVWYAGPGRISLDLAVPLPGGAAGRFPGFGPTLATPIVPGTGPDPANGKFPDPPPVAVTLAGHAVQASSTISNPTSGKQHIWLKVRPRANGTVQAGNWLLVLRQLQNASTPYHIWGMYTGQDRHFLFEFGKQDPTTTVENPGTAHNVITVGAYHGPTGTRGTFSGRGPTTDPRTVPKPDVSAPGIGILSAKALARGNGKGRYVELSGTSQAAPYVTGVVALMLEANKNLSHEQIARFLRETCDKPDGVSDPPPADSGWGAGKVNAEKAVNKAKESAGTALADEPLVLPTAAYVTAQEPVTELLAALRARVEHTEAGRLLGKLIGTHAPEIQRLIHLHRRLLVAWLRLHGPQLVRLALHSEQCHRIPIPARLGGKPVAAGLARLLDELIPFAGPELRADIAQYREFVLAVPGVPADDYDQLPRNEA